MNTGGIIILIVPINTPLITKKPFRTSGRLFRDPALDRKNTLIISNLYK